MAHQSPFLSLLASATRGFYFYVQSAQSALELFIRMSNNR
ncbi:hypothetical protein T12_3226 [Trichinella patagoniensis]|uniref:Uncharacterized protein n=1 Tax=Trichinella patagoniensis TaxID=990121 RepID=A0A0V0Z064_9BILA|nr:hypothetical protein T12_3226 [Trichinella patagoniensis]